MKMGINYLKKKLGQELICELNWNQIHFLQARMLSVLKPARHATRSNLYQQW